MFDLLEVCDQSKQINIHSLELIQTSTLTFPKLNYNWIFL